MNNNFNQGMNIFNQPRQSEQQPFGFNNANNDQGRTNIFTQNQGFGANNNANTNKANNFGNKFKQMQKNFGIRNERQTSKPFQNFSMKKFSFGGDKGQGSGTPNIFSGVQSFNQNKNKSQGNIFTNQQAQGNYKSLFMGSNSGNFKTFGGGAKNFPDQRRSGGPYGDRSNMGFFSKNKGFQDDVFAKNKHGSQMPFGNKKSSPFKFGERSMGEGKSIFAKNLTEVKEKKMESKYEEFRQKKGKMKFRNQERERRPPRSNLRNKERNLNQRKYSNDDYIVMSPKRKGIRISKKKKGRRTPQSNSVKSDSEQALNAHSEEEPAQDLLKMKNMLKAKLKAKKKPLNYSLKRVEPKFNVFLSDEQVKVLKTLNTDKSWAINEQVLMCQLEEPKLKLLQENINTKIFRSQYQQLKNMDIEYKNHISHLLQVTILKLVREHSY